jgi:hypothetical protein
MLTKGTLKVNLCKKSCPLFVSIRPLIINHKSPRYDIVIKRKLIRCHLNNNYITIDFITQSIINKIIEHLNLITVTFKVNIRHFEMNALDL